MAEAYEIAASREINDEENPSAETLWQVVGALSYFDARAALDAVIPTSFTFPDSRVAYLDGVRAVELRDEEYFQFRASYNSLPTPEFEQVDYDFEIGIQNEHITHAIATAAYAKPGRQAPDFGGAIGVSANGIAGVDVPKARFSFSLTKHWKFEQITRAYQIQLAAVTGKLNASTFYGLPAQSVMFLGARGSRSGDKLPINYAFEYAEAETSVSIDGIFIPSKPGWHHTDVFYKPNIDEDSEGAVSRAHAVYVHQVIQTANFALLNIGT